MNTEVTTRIAFRQLNPRKCFGARLCEPQRLRTPATRRINLDGICLGRCCVSQTNSVRHEKRRRLFSLSPRSFLAGRELERGETDKKRPPLPDPLLLFWRRGRSEALVRSKQTTCRTEMASRLP